MRQVPQTWPVPVTYSLTKPASTASLLAKSPAARMCASCRSSAAPKRGLRSRQAAISAARAPFNADTRLKRIRRVASVSTKGSPLILRNPGVENNSIANFVPKPGASNRVRPTIN